MKGKLNSSQDSMECAIQSFQYSHIFPSEKPYVYIEYM